MRQFSFYFHNCHKLLRRHNRDTSQQLKVKGKLQLAAGELSAVGRSVGYNLIYATSTPLLLSFIFTRGLTAKLRQIVTAQICAQRRLRPHIWEITFLIKFIFSVNFTARIKHTFRTASCWLLLCTVAPCCM